MIVAIRDADDAIMPSVAPASSTSRSTASPASTSTADAGTADAAAPRRRLAAVGVTTSCRRSITASEESIVAALGDRRGAASDSAGARMRFPTSTSRGRSFHPRTVRAAHIRGACPAAGLRRVRALAARLRGGLVGMVTLSPHMPGAGVHPRWPRGVHVAIGHTGAPEQITGRGRRRRALSTHLGNGAAADAAATPEFHLDAARRRPADGNLHRRRPSPAGRHIYGDGAGKGLSRAILVSDSVGARRACRPASTTSRSAARSNLTRTAGSASSARPISPAPRAR